MLLTCTAATLPSASDLESGPRMNLAAASRKACQKTNRLTHRNLSNKKINISNRQPQHGKVLVVDLPSPNKKSFLKMFYLAKNLSFSPELPCQLLLRLQHHRQHERLALASPERNF